MKQNQGILHDAAAGPKPSGRLQFIDGAKGFALICVMLGHTDGGPLVTYIDNMLLPVFWVAAGYTSRADFSISGRFRSLILPYLLMSAVCLMFTLVINPDAIGLSSMAGIVYSRFKLYPFVDIAGSYRMMNLYNSVLWFLTSMFTAYCLFRLILNIRNLVLQVLAGIASVALGYLYPSLSVLLPWSIDSAFFIAPLMLSGSLMRRFGIIDRYAVPAMLLSVAAYAVCNHYAGPTNYSIREMGTAYPASFGCGVSGALVAFVLFRFRCCSYMSRAFAFLNAKALYIFGLQLIFLEIGLRFGLHFRFPLWLTVSLQIMLATAGGYVTGILSDRLIGMLTRLRTPKRSGI